MPIRKPFWQESQEGLRQCGERARTGPLAAEPLCPRLRSLRLALQGFPSHLTSIVHHTQAQGAEVMREGAAGGALPPSRTLPIINTHAGDSDTGWHVASLLFHHPYSGRNRKARSWGKERVLLWSGSFDSRLLLGERGLGVDCSHHAFFNESIRS